MGFVHPIALLFGALLGVLVLLYLWERRRHEIPVPSLLLWQTLREDTVRATRFRPDLLFLLQALALACLVIGLARPYFNDARDAHTAARHILVVDTSASMQARESGGTRWALARARALQEVRSLASGSEIMLIAGADAPEVLVPFTRDRRSLERALEELEPVDTGGDLSVALAYANSARAHSEVPTYVTVHTDRPADELPAAVRSQVRVEQIGSTDDNVAIEALHVFQGRFQEPRSATIETRLRNFADRDRHGLLTVELEDSVLLRTGFTLAPRAVQTFTMSNLPGAGRVVAHLAADDALSIDDTAYGLVRPVRPLRVLVVTAATRWAAALAKIGNVTPGIDLSVLAPGAPLPSEGVDVVLFYRLAPLEPPRANTLHIYPPADSPLFVANGEAIDADVLDWNARHPVMRWLRPVLVQPFARAHIVSPPPGSQGLLWSRAGDREYPLAFANEQDGRRSVCLTFDFDADQLLNSDNVGLFLFLLNTLAWLAPDHDDLAVVRTGETYTIADAPAPTVTVQDPHGQERLLTSTPLALTPRYAGEYQIRVDGSERRLLVNFFDAAESDIGRKPVSAPDAVPVVSARAGALSVPPPDFGHWVYATALILLLAEWWAASRKRA